MGAGHSSITFEHDGGALFFCVLCACDAFATGCHKDNAITSPGSIATLHVATGGSEFRTIQSAVDAAPSTGAVISIGAGVYRERVTIDKPNVQLRGQSVDARQTVVVFDASADVVGDTFKTATVQVRSANFRAENVTFANDFDRAHEREPKKSQALALLVSGDRAVFRNVALLGHQDTLYAGSSDCSPPGHEPVACTPTRQYFERCFIEGDVDFIFGNSLAVFERCEIHSTEHSIGYITAQGKQDPREQSLFVFNHCKLTADAAVSHVWLGRPWRPLASVVFLNTEIGAHVEPAGFREWHPGETQYIDSVFYAEYNSTGPGARPGERDPHIKALTVADASRYETNRFLAGKDNWNPAVGP